MVTNGFILGIQRLLQTAAGDSEEGSQGRAIHYQRFMGVAYVTHLGRKKSDSGEGRMPSLKLHFFF